MFEEINFRDVKENVVKLIADDWGLVTDTAKNRLVIVRTTRLKGVETTTARCVYFVSELALRRHFRLEKGNMARCIQRLNRHGHDEICPRLLSNRRELILIRQFLIICRIIAVLERPRHLGLGNHLIAVIVEAESIAREYGLIHIALMLL